VCDVLVSSDSSSRDRPVSLSRCTSSNASAELQFGISDPTPGLQNSCPQDAFAVDLHLCLLTPSEWSCVLPLLWGGRAGGDGTLTPTSHGMGGGCQWGPCCLPVVKGDLLGGSWCRHTCVDVMPPAQEGSLAHSFSMCSYEGGHVLYLRYCCSGRAELCSGFLSAVSDLQQWQKSPAAPPVSHDGKGMVRETASKPFRVSLSMGTKQCGSVLTPEPARKCTVRCPAPAKVILGSA